MLTQIKAVMQNIPNICVIILTGLASVVKPACAITSLVHIIFVRSHLSDKVYTVVHDLTNCCKIMSQ